LPATIFRCVHRHRALPWWRSFFLAPALPGFFSLVRNRLRLRDIDRWPGFVRCNEAFAQSFEFLGS